MWVCIYKRVFACWFKFLHHKKKREIERDAEWLLDNSGSSSSSIRSINNVCGYCESIRCAIMCVRMNVRFGTLLWWFATVKSWRLHWFVHMRRNFACFVRYLYIVVVIVSPCTFGLWYLRHAYSLKWSRCVNVYVFRTHWSVCNEFSMQHILHINTP